MAKHRWINTKFWEDNYIINLLPDEKLLYLYFLTCPMSNICGVYECPLKIMAVHTGFDRENLETILTRFNGKIHYVDGWVYIRNFVKHQSASPKVKKGIDTEFREVPEKIKLKIREIEKQYEAEKTPALFSFENDILEEMADEPHDIKQVYSTVNEEFVKKFVEAYNTKIYAGSKYTAGAKDKMKIRYSEFTEQELMECIDKFSASSWWMANNRSRGLEWFLRSNSQVNKWLELEVEDNSSVKI